MPKTGTTSKPKSKPAPSRPRRKRSSNDPSASTAHRRRSSHTHSRSESLTPPPARKRPSTSTSASIKPGSKSAPSGTGHRFKPISGAKGGKGVSEPYRDIKGRSRALERMEGSGVSMDTATTGETGETADSEVAEEPRRRSRGGRKEGDASETETDSDDEGSEEEEYRGRRGKQRHAKEDSRRESRGGRKLKKRGQPDGISSIISGQKLSADQVTALLAMLGKGSEALIGAMEKEGLGMAMDEEGGMGETGEVDLRLEDDEEDEAEYATMARECRHSLEDRLQAITDENRHKIASYKADSIVKSVKACVEAQRGDKLLKEYYDWTEAERAYKKSMVAGWNDTSKALKEKTEALVNKAKELEVAVAERMRIVAAARKAFADKSEEHRAEIEGFKIELEKSRKKHVKLYKKYTDEDAIAKDVGMRIKDAMSAFADNLIVHGAGKNKGNGKKRMAEEEDEEEDEAEAGEDDDDEEEVEEEEES